MLSRDAGALPPAAVDLPAAFTPLLAQGHALGPLRAVALHAKQLGVAPVSALLASGLVTPAGYAMALARHWRSPVLSAADMLAPDTRLASLGAGMARLADGRWLLSVDADHLDNLLQLPAGHLRGHLVLAAPAEFQAAVRAALAGRIAEEASESLPHHSPASSIRAGATRAQRALALALAVYWPAAFLEPSGVLLGIALFACAVLFAAAILMHLTLLAQAVPASAPIPREPDARLPRYGVLVPLYREARIVPKLLAALGRLDYPPEKLDIRICVEQDDGATRAALDAAGLPGWMQVVVVPPGQPRTKPRALNAGLLGMRAEFVAVYDAEDDPDPRQLRDAVALFRRADARTACLQAHLAIDNIDDSWLSRLFAMEYAALFEVLKPALARNELPVPLGGTSNHFRLDVLRALGGWDAWNVTEDADLGIRIARAGYRVVDLPSLTYEEAPVGLRAWLGQRRRWLKGWMQTMITHSRSPCGTARELGLAGTLALGTTVGSTVVGALGFPVLSGVFVLRLHDMAALGAGGPLVWLTDALALLVFLLGTCMMALPIALALYRRRMLALVPWMVLLPVYAVLASCAAWLALADLIWRPFHWSKTEHGLARRSRLRPTPGRHPPT
jgi:cellulose synthase/poly-beta-1,6-N-acetylglucosamine synthase-like glycosyltransferase